MEYIGYLATALVILSFMMKDVSRLRIVNAAGCILWVIYGASIQSMPIIITNMGILIINMYRLKFLYVKK